MSIRICDTRCCGVKELDGIDDFETPEGAMRSLCGVMAGGTYSSRFAFEVDPDVKGGQIRKTIVTPPKLQPNYSLLTFTGVVVRRQMDHSSARPDNYGQAFADYIGHHNLGPVSASTAVRSRRTTNDIQLWCWAFDLDRLQGWWLERAVAPVAVADVKIPPPKPLSGATAGSSNSYTITTEMMQSAAENVIRTAGGVGAVRRDGRGTYQQTMEEELRRLHEQIIRAEEFEARRMNPNQR